MLFRELRGRGGDGGTARAPGMGAVSYGPTHRPRDAPASYIRGQLSGHDEGGVRVRGEANSFESRQIAWAASARRESSRHVGVATRRGEAEKNSKWGVGICLANKFNLRRI